MERARRKLDAQSSKPEIDFHSLIHALLQNAYYVPGTAPGAEDINTGNINHKSARNPQRECLVLKGRKEGGRQEHQCLRGRKKKPKQTLKVGRRAGEGGNTEAKVDTGAKEKKH